MISRKFEWYRGDCNLFGGTDLSQFAPMVKKEDKLRVTLIDMCRSFDLIFKDEIIIHTVPAWRFIPSLKSFESAINNIDNQCFCIEKSECGFDGLFDLSLCRNGAPMFLSNPHFYDADTKLLNLVDGLKPDKIKHESFYDIEPVRTTSGKNTHIQMREISKVTLRFLTS